MVDDAVDPVDPGAMRASDADRDRVADRLREALSEGRLTPQEHAERIEAVFAARTYAELEPLVRDLPGGAPATPPVLLDKEPGGAPQPRPAAPQEVSPSVVTILSAADRKGRWLVAPHTTVTCVLGAVKLDFRQAVLSQAEVTVNVTNFMGSVEVIVPPGVRVINSATVIAGANEAPKDDLVDPGAPLIRISGVNMLGAISVKRKQAKKPRGSRRELRDRRRTSDRHP